MAWYPKRGTVSGMIDRIRPRGVRPELPAAIHSTLLAASNQFGRTALPSLTEGQALGLPAAYRAVNLIANGTASMAPMDLWKPDGVTRVTPTPPVIDRPLATMQTFDYWHMAVVSALMRGNYLGIQADFGADLYPNQVVPVHPDFAFAYIDGAGYTVYAIAGMPLLSADEVVHVRAFTTIGNPWGIGVVENFRRALGQQLDQQNYVASTYRTGSVPSVVIQLDRPEIDLIQAESAQDQWVAAHGAGNRKPAVLPSSMTVKPISFSPEDAQFIQARHMSVAEVAFMFNLDPSDLSANVGGQAQLYANIEQRQQQRVAEAYGPMMIRFEQAWTDLTPGSNIARFDPDRLMRTDSKTRAEVHQLNIATGVETVDEARQVERRPPLTAAQLKRLRPAPAAPGDPGAPPSDAGLQPEGEGATIAVTAPKVKL